LPRRKKNFLPKICGKMIFCNAIKIVIGELKVELTSVIKKIGEYWDQRSSGFDEEHDTEDLDA
jgi:hypothetical protein